MDGSGGFSFGNEMPTEGVLPQVPGRRTPLGAVGLGGFYFPGGVPAPPMSSQPGAGGAGGPSSGGGIAITVGGCHMQLDVPDSGPRSDENQPEQLHGNRSAFFTLVTRFICVPAAKNNGC